MRVWREENKVKLQFLGANRQVTGSRYFLQAGGLRLLIDCGLFQERAFLGRNWDASPVPPDQIDFLLLTHAHLDHSGLIPKLVGEGYSRPILTTAASAELARIVLLDSARIQEEDAAFKKKRHEREGRRATHPEIPLYTVADAEAALPLLEGVHYDEPVSLNDRVTVRYHDAGHILGSAMLELTVDENGQRSGRRLLFSGDIGQWDRPIIRDPSVFEGADYVVMESTYGDRVHEAHGDVDALLCDIVNGAVAAGGNVVIPTFAIERAQELMFHLSRLLKENRIPHLRIFLDSPMAVNVTEVFQRHPECLDEETLQLLRADESPFNFPGLKLVCSVEDSKAINHIKGSCIIMAGSGMCTGGRIKHHLIHNISRPESTLLFVGFQSKDTLGRQIVDGNSPVRIHGQNHPVRARVERLYGFSAHADAQGLLHWLSHFQSPPRHLFLTHGEAEVALKFGEGIQREWGWEVSVPEYQQEWELT